ncbi:MAG: 5'/3'-nucleotidase SurE, partial [Dehalococcoidia bacterium]|nr:5'/3'-nucleotidase SurE [Dehalococcoidia bacterium]
MNILLTNDDGIHSPGLWAIAEELAGIATVTVVVPDRDQSGMGA